eukprot:2384259-Prymnesium_polylepis.1
MPELLSTWSPLSALISRRGEPDAVDFLSSVGLTSDGSDSAMLGDEREGTAVCTASFESLPCKRARLSFSSMRLTEIRCSCELLTTAGAEMLWPTCIAAAGGGDGGAAAGDSDAHWLLVDARGRYALVATLHCTAFARAVLLRSAAQVLGVWSSFRADLGRSRVTAS